MKLLPANSWLFQIANCFLAISYVVPDLLVLRICLACAGLCFTLWGGIVLNVSVDTVVWNAVFCIINSAKAVQLIILRRPIKFTEPEHEEIYKRVFQPVGISRREFKLLAEIGLLRTLTAGSIYVETGNEAHNLSLLHSGHMEVYKKSSINKEMAKINGIKEFEFIESPEWAARIANMKTEPKPVQKEAPKENNEGVEVIAPSSHNKEEIKIEMDIVKKPQVSDSEDSDVAYPPTVMAVTIVATKECTFIMWPVENLMKLLNENPDIKAPMASIVASDVARKLFRQTGLSWQAPNENRLSPRKTNADSEKEDAILKFMQSQVNYKLPIAELKEMFRFGKWRKIHKKDTLFAREGESATEFAIVYEGEFEATKGEEDQERILHMAGPMQFLGSITYFTDDEHLAECTLRSAKPSLLLVWDAEHLRIFLLKQPNVMNLLNMLMVLDMSRKVKEIKF